MGGFGQGGAASGLAHHARCHVVAPGHAGSEGRRLIVVLDTAGVDGIVPIDERRRARLRVLRERATTFIVPAAVLAEGVLTGHVGHDFHVRRLLELVDVADVDEELGYAAGAIRQEAVRGGIAPVPSGVDAIVVATADAHAAHNDVQIITSDDDDLELLASLGAHPTRITLIVV